MSTHRFLMLKCLLVGATTLVIWFVAPNGALPSERLHALLKNHCLDCHGSAEEPAGDLDLSGWAIDAVAPRSPHQVQAMIDALGDGVMPPEEESTLGDKERSELLQLLEEALSEILPAAPQPTPMRRMNRFQYSNAVQDLFELDVAVFALPENVVRDHNGYFNPSSGKMPDTVMVGSRPLGKSQLIQPRLAGVAPFPQDLRAEHGFDNRADHLSLSPVLLEAFFRLSQSILHSSDFDAHCGIWNELFAAPEGDGDAQQLAGEISRRLGPFLERAFRRPVEPVTLERYRDVVQQALADGQSFSDSMKTAVAAVLVSPRFLYLFDRAAEPDAALDAWEVASRLSFFLWGSIPDQRLLDLARQGRLLETNVLTGQVERMLRDRRLKRFCDSFPAQWLQLDRIVSSVPDPQRYPDFYFSKYRVSMHMMLEPLLVFETILIEDRPILELIDSDFSYRSGLLSAWHASEQVPPKVKREPTKIPFHRVSLEDRRWGGVITNAAVMTMTSSPLRTQPITRGAWLASVILNDPPKPPPANVPELEEDDEKLEAGGKTLRQQLLDHQTRMDCKVCHQQIDPLGFALENYDPVGRWRDAYRSGLPIDSSSELFGQYQVTSMEAFKDVMLLEKDRFAAALASRLLEFAIGRPVAVGERDSIRRIVERTAEADYRMQALLKQVVLSTSFLQLPDTADDASPSRSISEEIR